MLESLKRPLRPAVHLLRRIVKRVCSAWRQPPPHEVGRRDYSEWVRLYDSWPEDRLMALASDVAALPIQPRFSVRLLEGEGDGVLRPRTLDSLKAQRYTRWQVDEPASGRQADWIVVLCPGAVLAPHALLSLVAEINRHPEAQLIYGDEDFLTSDGQRANPDFKPEWNPLLFYSTAWLSGLFAVRADVAGKAFSQLPPGDTEELRFLSATLAALEAVQPAHIHRLPRVLVHRVVSGAEVPEFSAPSATPEGAQLLQAHFDRQGVKAQVSVQDTVYRVRYALPETRPLVSIVIPTRNGLELMRQCVDSIFALTSYPEYEIIIVDNGSDDPAALAYFAELAAGPRVQVLRDESPFNYSALNNLAVRHAKGEVIVLMNNDIKVLTPDWLEEMVSFVMQPEVGAVGAKLLYPDDTVQHAGVILGIRTVAGHGHKQLKRHDRGYQGRAAVVQNFSAVTAACLAVRKDVWDQVGGLNEVDLKVAFNDVDFCIRLVQAGYRNVWTPYAELYHFESVSRGTEDSPEKRARFAGEVHFMRTEWAHVLLVDKAYNPALTLDDEDFGLAWPPRYSA